MLIGTWAYTQFFDSSTGGVDWWRHIWQIVTAAILVMIAAASPAGDAEPVAAPFRQGVRQSMACSRPSASSFSSLRTVVRNSVTGIIHTATSVITAMTPATTKM